MQQYPSDGGMGMPPPQMQQYPSQYGYGQGQGMGMPPPMMQPSQPYAQMDNEKAQQKKEEDDGCCNCCCCCGSCCEYRSFGTLVQGVSSEHGARPLDGGASTSADALDVKIDLRPGGTGADDTGAALAACCACSCFGCCQAADAVGDAVTGDDD